jgi:large subunit ribosomal protein L20
MTKVKYAPHSRKRKKKILKQAKGYWGDRSKRYRHAKEAVMKALVYAYRDRKTRKRQFRRLWISRINSACRNLGITYNRFIQGLKRKNIDLDRKSLAELAVNDQSAFEKLVEIAKK